MIMDPNARALQHAMERVQRETIYPCPCYDPGHGPDGCPSRVHKPGTLEPDQLTDHCTDCQAGRHDAQGQG